MTNKQESLPFDQIVHDREPAIKAVAEHLAKRGRCLPVLAGLYSAKAEIYIHHLNRCGIHLRPEAIFEELPAACDIFCKTLDERLGRKELPFDVLICNNDTSATAALGWLRSKGLRVPQDVAVIGFDNVETSKYLIPPLASVERQSDEITKLTSKMLFERLENPDLPVRCEIVPMRFVHRESAG